MAETNFPGEIEVWFIVRFRPIYTWFGKEIL